jgi:hypothetical protein
MDDKTEFPPPLPSREAGVPRRHARKNHDWLRWTVVAALVLVVLLVVFVPRPAFQIDRVDFVTTACDPTSHTYQVTASMTIRNAGGAGVASVHLLIEGRIAATGHYEVPAREGIQRGLSAIVTDCQWHRFSVELFVESA